MKIAFNWPIANSHNGPSFFLSRLAVALQKEIKIVSDLNDSDLYVVFVSDSADRLHELKKRGVKIIQRLDNIYFDSRNTLGDSRQLNAPILESYRLADAVVFQSEFSKKLIENHFGKKEISTVIHNGIELQRRKDKDDNIIICSASWRRHKRLKEIVDVFVKLDDTYRLVILGKPDISISHPRISNIVAKNFDEVMYLYIKASVFLHLCWFDSCPNAVVEALSVGLPVVCGNQGGTKELIQMTNGGCIVQTDGDFDFGMVDLYNPPPMNGTEEIVDFILSKEYPIVDREPIRIDACAAKYIDFFERTLCLRKT